MAVVGRPTRLWRKDKQIYVTGQVTEWRNVWDELTAEIHVVVLDLRPPAVRTDKVRTRQADRNRRIIKQFLLSRGDERGINSREHHAG